MTGALTSWGQYLKCLSSILGKAVSFVAVGGYDSWLGPGLNACRCRIRRGAGRFSRTWSDERDCEHQTAGAKRNGEAEGIVQKLGHDYLLDWV